MGHIALWVNIYLCAHTFHLPQQLFIQHCMQMWKSTLKKVCSPVCFCHQGEVIHILILGKPHFHVLAVDWEDLLLISLENKLSTLLRSFSFKSCKFRLIISTRLSAFCAWVFSSFNFRFVLVLCWGLEFQLLCESPSFHSVTCQCT